MQETKRLLGIEAGRGAAAVLVMLYHAQRMLALEQYVGHPPLGSMFRFGNAGVDFFFVLSGFVIYFVHRADIGRPERLSRYLWRRVTRIYPVYWVVLALSIAISAVAGRLWDLDLRSILFSFLLIHHDQSPLLGVAWTLEHEMLFYGVFAIGIINRMCGIVAIIVWGALVAIASIRPFGVDALDFLGSAYHAEFFLGIASAAIVQRGLMKQPGLLLWTGGLAFFGAGAAVNTGAIDHAGIAARTLFGTSSACILIALAVLEQQGRLRISHVPVFLGACSYSLYLIHTTTIGLTARVLMWIGIVKLIPGWSVLSAVLLVSVSAAAILHVSVERPLMDRLNRKRRVQRLPISDGNNVPSRV